MEPTTGAASSLRPLGLGEVLDRAVNLCVRHFTTFALIYLVFAVPLAVFQFFGTQDQAKVFGALTDMLQQQAHTGKPADPEQFLKTLSHGPVFNVWTALALVSLLLVGPLPKAALISATSASYLGGSARFADAYRVALQKWLPLIGINLLYLGCGFVAYILLIVVAVVTGLALSLLVALLHAVGIAIAVAVGLVVVLAVLALAVVVGLALQVSYFTCVVENVPFVLAFSQGLQRVFQRVGLRRSLLVGLAYIAIVIGILVVSLLGQSVLFGLLHSNVAGTVYTTAVSIATAAFTTAFVGIFYFDLRVREEGLDLQLATLPPG